MFGVVRSNVVAHFRKEDISSTCWHLCGSEYVRTHIRPNRYRTVNGEAGSTDLMCLRRDALWYFRTKETRNDKTIFLSTFVGDFHIFTLHPQVVCHDYVQNLVSDPIEWASFTFHVSKPDFGPTIVIRNAKGASTEIWWPRFNKPDLSDTGLVQVARRATIFSGCFARKNV